MVTEVARLDVSLRRRSLLVSTAAMAAFVIAVVALYPVFMRHRSLVGLFHRGAGPAAVFGVSGTLTSPSGWLNAYVYSSVFPLVTLLLTIGYGAWAVAGQENDGSLGMLSTLPVHRSTIAVQKVAVMLALSLVVAVVVTGCALLGQLFDVKTSVSAVVTTSAAVALVGFDFGLISMAIGTLTAKRGLAIAITALVAAVSYGVGAVAQVVDVMRPGRYASVFFWSVQNGQISHGVTPVDFAVLGAVAVVLLAITLPAFQRLDLH
jgi:ABC-2 type transport system permease protein